MSKEKVADELFKGTNNIYRVVSNDRGVKWCINITVAASHLGADIIARFAMIGFTKKPPRMFTLRNQQLFVDQKGESFKGLLLDRIDIPVSRGSGTLQDLKELCDSMEVFSIIEDWVVRQLTLEGLTLSCPINVESTLTQSIDNLLKVKPKPVFEIPVDLKVVPASLKFKSDQISDPSGWKE
jgi:hypothetical protein